MPDQQFNQVISLLSSGELKQAEALCTQTLLSDPDNVNMLGLLGVIQMKTGQLDAAEATLSKTIELEPSFAKPHEDLARLYMHRQQPEKAEPLFRCMTELEPQSSSAWFGLAHALKAQGKSTQASEAAYRADQLSPLKQMLDKAESCNKDGKYSEAHTICSQILAREPANIRALRLLAIIATNQGDAVETERLLKKIIEIAPDAPQPATELARFYAQHERHSESLCSLQKSVQLDSKNPDTQLELAKALALIGLPAPALQAFDAAQVLNPSSKGGQVGRAHALRALGRTQEAISSYQHCIHEDFGAAEAWWNLSSLRTYEFSADELQKMLKLRASSKITQPDAIYLDFAIGKAMDDREQFDQAWEYYSSGNTARRSTVYYDGATTEVEIDLIIKVSNQLLTNLSENIHNDVTPIFIIGMPRSGSTLVEQILVSHSQVEATTELPYMLSLVKRHLISSSGPLPSSTTSQPSITSFSEQQLLNLADQYIRATKPHRPHGSPYFIDKMPDNFQLIGVLSLLLPRAKFIDVRRHPLDTCVGNYRQLFARGKNFSYDLYEMAEYYLQYARIMRHWNELLPGKVLSVQYEDLIEYTEREISRILSYCGLEWEESCVNFHQTQRTITSASSEQVRQPIYRSAMGFWKNYEAHLGELMEVLKPVLS